MYKITKDVQLCTCNHPFAAVNIVSGATVSEDTGETILQIIVATNLTMPLSVPVMFMEETATGDMCKSITKYMQCFQLWFGLVGKN